MARKPRKRKAGLSAGLTRDAIEERALKLIDEGGLEGFSLRSLAAALGVEPMSLYNYYSSRLDLLNALLDRQVRSFVFLPSDRPWEERVRHAAREWRRVSLSHPGFFPFFAVHRLNTGEALGFLERLLEIFRDTGLSRELAARYFRIFGYYLMGNGLDETMGYAEGPSATKTLEPEEEARRFPLVHEYGEFFDDEHRPKTFELGLGVLIEAMRESLS